VVDLVGVHVDVTTRRAVPEAIMAGALDGLRVAVPESRELDLFVSMLERAGARALRCPLVSIHDLDDAAAVEAWIRRLASGEMDDLVLYTGEGVKRMLSVAKRAGIEAGYVEGLRRVRKIVRGPKPARVLRTLGLAAEPMDWLPLCPCWRWLAARSACSSILTTPTLCSIISGRPALRSTPFSRIATPLTRRTDAWSTC
jgi:hypothetical protein